MSEEEKIRQLQMMEQNLTTLLLQKQQLQAQLMDIESAIKELEKVEQAYRIVGNIMVKKDKEELLKELKSEKELIELKLRTIATQENKIKKKAKELQEDIIKQLEKKK